MVSPWSHYALTHFSPHFRQVFALLYLHFCNIFKMHSYFPSPKIDYLTLITYWSPNQIIMKNVLSLFALRKIKTE